MRAAFHLRLVVVALFLAVQAATADFLRSLEAPTTSELGASNGTALVDSEETRLWAQKRCAKADVCFNNPGYFNGFRMHKISRIRNGYTCTSVCVPTGACLFTACTGNFFFWTLGLKNLLGWECGTCPQ